MTPIRIVLADDHTLLRAGVRSLLLDMEGIEVVAEAAEGREAMSLVEAHHPEILLTDIAMPGIGGLDLAARVVKAHPRTRVVILSMHKDEEYVRLAVIAGASGYLLKDSDTEELGLALLAVARGETYFSPAVSKYVAAGYRKLLTASPGSVAVLTPRQRDVLRRIAGGMTTKAIAKSLGIKTKTVEWHRGVLMERLNIHDLASLVRFAIRFGIVEPDD